MSGHSDLVSTDLVNSYPRPSVTELWVRTIIASSLAYCIIIASYFNLKNFQNNITSSLEGTNKYVYFSLTLSTLLRFVSNFVPSNYFLDFYRAMPGNSAGINIIYILHMGMRGNMKFSIHLPAKELLQLFPDAHKYIHS